MSKSRLSHAEAAEQFIKDEPRTNWHDETLWFVRQKEIKPLMVYQNGNS